MVFPATDGKQRAWDTEFYEELHQLMPQMDVLGHGDDAILAPRNPRLEFEEAHRAVGCVGSTYRQGHSSQHSAT